MFLGILSRPPQNLRCQKQCPINQPVVRIAGLEHGDLIKGRREIEAGLFCQVLQTFVALQIFAGHQYQAIQVETEWATHEPGHALSDVATVSRTVV